MTYEQLVTGYLKYLELERRKGFLSIAAANLVLMDFKNFLELEEVKTISL